MELQSGLIMLDGLKQFIMYDNEDVGGVSGGWQQPLWVTVGDPETDTLS